MDQERERYLNSVNLNIHTNFPYLVLDVKGQHAQPRNPGFQVMHWHEDLQFGYVLEGTLEICTLEASWKAGPGEGFFINQNVIHRVKQLGQCRYKCFIFPAYFLEFYQGSPAEKLVKQLTGKRDLACLTFPRDGSWRELAAEELKQLADLEQQKTEFYPYEVLVHLAFLWLTLQKNLTLPGVKKESTVELRLGKILRYMEAHYGEEVTLENLAASAAVSKSECIRCFRTGLHTTPYKYLLEYRLSRAAQLLSQTDEPVVTIAAKVGFNQVSQFGKLFWVY